MKKNLLRLMTIGLVASPLFFQGCSKDFLEAKPKGTDFEEFYYRNETEAMNGLVAVYDVLGYQSGNYVSKLAAMNIASDDMLAGGGGLAGTAQWMESIGLAPGTLMAVLGHHRSHRIPPDLRGHWYRPAGVWSVG